MKEPKIMEPRVWLTLAAVWGFMAVCAGAFGAHGVSDPEAKSWLQTGGHYQLVHALAVFACYVAWGCCRARPQASPPGCS